MDSLEPILRGHPFFANFADEHIRLVTGCARNRRFEVDQYLFHEGESADEFFLIRHGKVALEIHSPGQPPMVLATLDEGEIAGVSWLVPPYRWMFDARTLEPTRALGIDAACLRNKCDADHDLGYTMMTRFLPAIVKRLHATRLQILDIYGKR